MHSAFCAWLLSRQKVELAPDRTPAASAAAFRAHNQKLPPTLLGAKLKEGRRAAIYGRTITRTIAAAGAARGGDATGEGEREAPIRWGLC
jgi:hypothetical protein